MFKLWRERGIKLYSSPMQQWKGDLSRCKGKENIKKLLLS